MAKIFCEVRTKSTPFHAKQLINKGNLALSLKVSTLTIATLKRALIKIEDRIAQFPVITRQKGTTPLIGVVALEQMGNKVDPTGKLIKGLPLML
jgi:predicted aspartyl protease